MFSIYSVVRGPHRFIRNQLLMGVLEMTERLLGVFVATVFIQKKVNANHSSRFDTRLA